MVKKMESIDRESLDILRHLVGKDFSSVVTRYLNDSEYYIQQLDAAFKNASYREIFDLAHTLKGSSGTLSASRLHDICADLELAINRNASFGQLAQLLNAVDSEFQLVKKALQEYLESSVKDDITESVLP